MTIANVGDHDRANDLLGERDAFALALSLIPKYCEACGAKLPVTTAVPDPMIPVSMPIMSGEDDEHGFTTDEHPVVIGSKVERMPLSHVVRELEAKYRAAAERVSDESVKADESRTDPDGHPFPKIGKCATVVSVSGTHEVKYDHAGYEIPETAKRVSVARTIHYTKPESGLVVFGMSLFTIAIIGGYFLVLNVIQGIFIMLTVLGFVGAIVMGFFGVLMIGAAYINEPKHEFKYIPLAERVNCWHAARLARHRASIEGRLHDAEEAAKFWRSENEKMSKEHERDIKRFKRHSIPKDWHVVDEEGD